MRNLKSLIALLMAAVLVLGLVGCSSAGADKTEKEKLIAILDEMADKTGEEGMENKLIAMGSFGKLIAWCKETDMKPGEIASVVGQWIDGRTPEQQAAIKEKLAQLGDALSRFGSEGGSELMDKLGIDPGSWSESAKDVLDSITKSVKK